MLEKPTAIQGVDVLTSLGWLKDTTVVIQEGKFVSIEPIISPKGAILIEARGLQMLPGIVDLHGDAFERMISPRPGISFPMPMAIAEFPAIPYLRYLFGKGVTEPIRMHVEAKRYLCFAIEDYWVTLSAASQRSLELQGGIFSSVEAAAFIAQPHAKAAVQLRIWDDEAKVPGKMTQNLAHFTQIMATCVR
jgi:hypothetical protein